jgi:hypothetical protein
MPQPLPRLRGELSTALHASPKSNSGSVRYAFLAASGAQPSRDSAPKTPHERASLRRCRPVVAGSRGAGGCDAMADKAADEVAKLAVVRGPAATARALRL